MSKSVVINLGYGDLKQGFPRVSAQLWVAGHPLPEQFIGSLPSAPHLLDLYQHWRIIYENLCSRKVIRHVPDDDELEIAIAGVTNVSQFTFDDLCQQLETAMNAWLNSEGLTSLSRQLRSALHKSEDIRVILETSDDLMRRLPWHRCGFFCDYGKAEIAIAQPEYQRQETLQAKKRTSIRILAIIGDSQGIDLEAEIQALKNLNDELNHECNHQLNNKLNNQLNTQVVFLKNPNRQELSAHLWDNLGWDIIFFAGHSRSEGSTGRLYINSNQTNNSITIEQLEEGLKAAIDKGLKLAIFNSCDGMGLAFALSKLQLPTTIVMREPVPNLVAQVFFNNFLTAFAIEHLPLYSAVQKARRQLQGLENDFPGASWLPVICQNPAVEPPTWLTLGGMAPCPYRGLFAFREQDAHLFFGREQFTRDLVAAVKKQQLVAVVGASGSGKSSVVFAGLIPSLRQDTNCNWEIASFRPGNNPITALAAALGNRKWGLEGGQGGIENLFPHSPSPSLPLSPLPPLPPSLLRLREIDLEIAFKHDDRALYRVIDRHIQQNPRTRLVLIVDQFEELYTLCPESERQHFLNVLLNAIKYAPGLTLVLTLRADFYGHALSDRNFSDLLQGNVQNLAPMSRDELRSAIVSPAARMQIQLEDGLTNQLISAVYGHAGRLPLLEFALTQLWGKQCQGVLTNSAYTEIGGVEEALANHAETEYAQLGEIDRNRAQRIFMQLVQLGDGCEPTRRLAMREEVKEENWDLVTRLASSRLVVTNRNESTCEETVEIVHEALVRNWGRLRYWIQVDGEFRHWQEQLRLGIRQWEKSNRDNGVLLRGKLLTDAEHWQNHRCDELSASDRNFINASLDLRQRKLHKQKRDRRLTIFGLSVGLVLSLILAGYALRQSRRAQVNEVLAVEKSSQALLASNNRLDALVEAMAAWQKFRSLNLVGDDTKDAEKSLKATLQNAVYSASLLQHVNTNFAEFNRLSDFKAAVYAVAYSPNNQLIATGSADKSVKLWGQDSKLLANLPGHKGTVWGVAFSPDSKTLVSVSDDKTVKVWGLDEFGKYKQLRSWNDDAEIYTVSFNPNQQIIATGGKNKTVKIWKLDGTLITQLQGHTAAIRAVEFSRDGNFIASGSEDGTVKIWQSDITTSKTNKTNYQLLYTLKHQGVVRTVAFSPDGEIIATAGADKVIKLWQTSDGKFLNSLNGHNDTVYSIAWSPNGQTLASASQDKTIKLWQRNGGLQTTLKAHTDRIYAIAFSPDGQSMASSARDRTVKLWKSQKNFLTALNGHQDNVSGVEFSPDGKNIVTASWDGTVKLWKPDGTLINSFTGHKDRVYTVAYSPKGEMIASGSRDKSIKLWKPNGELIKTLENAHEGWVSSIVFNPDGEIFASSGRDNDIRIWKKDGTQITTFKGHTDGVNRLAFSADGKILVSGSSDNTIRIWSREGIPLHTLKSHEDEVTGVAISPDSKTIASTSLDRTIKLWKIADGSLIKTITGNNQHTDAIRSITFSPDGKIMASASIDKTIKMWKSDGQFITTLKAHNDSVTQLKFSLDNKKLVSASSDKTVVLWDLAQIVNLDKLLPHSCEWVGDYINNNPTINNNNINPTSIKRVKKLCRNRTKIKPDFQK